MNNIALKKIMEMPTHNKNIELNIFNAKKKFVNNKDVNPFIKWAGGKSALLEDIRKFYPSTLGKK